MDVTMDGRSGDKGDGETRDNNWEVVEVPPVGQDADGDTVVNQKSHETVPTRLVDKDTTGEQRSVGRRLLSIAWYVWCGQRF